MNADIDNNLVLLYFSIDSANYDLSVEKNNIISFMKNAEANGGTILVHCVSGHFQLYII